MDVSSQRASENEDNQLIGLGCSENCDQPNICEVIAQGYGMRNWAPQQAMHYSWMHKTW